MTLPRGAAALLLGLPGTLVAQNVAEVQVAPPSITVKVGERSGLLATAFDRVGNVIPTVRVFWSSNNIQIARVDNNGTVTGVANGVAIIEARLRRRPGRRDLEIVAPRHRQRGPERRRRGARVRAGYGADHDRERPHGDGAGRRAADRLRVPRAGAHHAWPRRGRHRARRRAGAERPDHQPARPAVDLE